MSDTHAGADPTRLIEEVRRVVNGLLKAGKVTKGRRRRLLSILDELEAMLKATDPPATWRQALERNLPFIAELIRLFFELAKGNH